MNDLIPCLLVDAYTLTHKRQSAKMAAVRGWMGFAVGTITAAVAIKTLDKHAVRMQSVNPTQGLASQLPTASSPLNGLVQDLNLLHPSCATATQVGK